MSASKEDEDEDVVFEGVKGIVKKMGESSIAAKRVAKKDGLNGVAHSSESSTESSSEDDDEEDDSDLSLPMPPPRKVYKNPFKPDEDDILSTIKFQRRDDPRALLTHERLCDMREKIESLEEERDPSQRRINTNGLNGMVMTDPFHTISAIDHNLWVLASAASLRLNEVGERCKLLTREGQEQDNSQQDELMSKALATLSGEHVGFKERPPEKPSRGRAPVARIPPVPKPPPRERPVRGRAEPKKRQPPQPKEAPEPTVGALSSRVATPSVNETAKNGKGARKEEESTVNTRKRKREKEEKEEKEEKKEAKSKGKASNTTAKRASARTAKKAKEDEPTYCSCNRISFGEMVGCDNPTCEIEWFHFECINLKVKPKGKWYCPDCRAEPNNYKQPKKSSK